MMRVELTRFLVSAEDSICHVMASIDRNTKGIALAVDGELRLIGTVTDGDIRRGLLRGLTLETPIKEVFHRNALVAPETLGPEAVMHLMRANDVRHIPLVDEAGRV